MLFISLLMNVPTVCLTQKVHTFPAQPGLTIAEQILGGAETVESLTLFPLQRREGLDGVRANFNFTTNVITNGRAFIRSYRTDGCSFLL